MTIRTKIAGLAAGFALAAMPVAGSAQQFINILTGAA